MHEFGKVVLSRKGFDSSAGGSYSPFDPQTGKYIVLPIPELNKDVEICKSLKYEDIQIKSNYLDGYSETNLKSLMEAMRRKGDLKGEESEYAHFDPWLGRCPWLAEHSNHQIGAFGQIGMPQQHLYKQKVGEDSLFLFFSRFKPIKPTGQNRENAVVPAIGGKKLNGGLYFIYGWLKVKKVVQPYENIHDPLLSLLSHHPHATKKYLEKENNTIYVADEFLFNDGSNIRGCGYFPILNKDLLLTAPAQESEKSWIPSRWRLPGFFFEKPPSVLKHWDKCDDSCLVKTNWQWQEAVFDFGESEKFYPWFRNLLKQVVSDL